MLEGRAAHASSDSSSLCLLVMLTMAQELSKEEERFAKEFSQLGIRGIERDNRGVRRYPFGYFFNRIESINGNDA